MHTRRQVAVITLTLSLLIQVPFLAAPAHAVQCPATITVATAADLANVGNCLTSSFTQVVDIVLTGAWTPIGSSGTPFTGTYNGGGHTISGLNATGTDEVGLFGYVSGGTITDTHVSGTSTGTDQVGGLVGVVAGGTVTGSSFDGTVTASAGDNGVGGLIGRILPVSSATTVENSRSSANVSGGTSGTGGGLIGYAYCLPGSTIRTSYATGSVSTVNGEAGGLIGDLEAQCSLSDSYARGTASSSMLRAGSLVGVVGGAGNTVTRAYGTGAVSAATAGGIVGGELTAATWSSSFWDTQSTGQSQAKAAGPLAGTTGQPTSGMTSLATFANAGWSIVSGWAASGTTWGLCPGVNDGYPYLQAFFASNPCDDGQTPPPWPQAYGRGSTDTCPPGWNPSWAEWPNGNTGGFVCQHTLTYNRSTGKWDVRRLTLPHA